MKRTKDVHSHLKRMLALILEEAHAWHNQDPDATDLVTVAERLAAGHLPERPEDLFVALTLYGEALTHHTTLHPIRPPAPPPTDPEARLLAAHAEMCRAVHVWTRHITREHPDVNPAHLLRTLFPRHPHDPTALPA